MMMMMIIIIIDTDGSHVSIAIIRICYYDEIVVQHRLVAVVLSCNETVPHGRLVA